MSNFKLSFVIEKKLQTFLDMPEKSLINSVNYLCEKFSNKYKVNQIELRNNSCQEEKYSKIKKCLKPEIEKLQNKGFNFTLHATCNIEDSENLDKDILNALKNDIELAKFFNIPLIVTHASFSIKSLKETKYYSIMHLLPELNKLGEENNIKIAIENIALKNKILQNTNDHLFILDYIRKNNLENIGITIDFGHAISCGFNTDYLVNVIETAKEKLFHIHAHESEFGEDKHNFLEGRLDWKRILQTLEKINYTGSFVLEVRLQNIFKSLEYLESIGAEFKNN